jgi:hypothetical protein
MLISTQKEYLYGYAHAQGLDLYSINPSLTFISHLQPSHFLRPTKKTAGRNNFLDFLLFFFLKPARQKSSS